MDITKKERGKQRYLNRMQRSKRVKKTRISDMNWQNWPSDELMKPNHQDRAVSIGEMANMMVLQNGQAVTDVSSLKFALTRRERKDRNGG